MAVEIGNLKRAPAKLTCPDCGSPMVLRETAKYRHTNGDARMFYGCSNYPRCTTCHGAHPDGRPLGTPADKATREARIAAHAAFDRLWKPELGGTMRRKDAYRHMREVMGMTKAEAHIGRFTAAECRTLIERLSAGERMKP